MDNVIIKDDLKKESKLPKELLILRIVLAIALPFSLIGKEFKIAHLILCEVFWMLAACDDLYYYLCYIKYELIVTNEKLVITSLRTNIEIEIKDIKSYKIKKSKKIRRIRFYTFFIYCENQKIEFPTRFKDELDIFLKETINTRYRDRFDDILRSGMPAEEEQFADDQKP